MFLRHKMMRETALGQQTTLNVVKKCAPEYNKFGFIMEGSDAYTEAQCTECCEIN